MKKSSPPVRAWGLESLECRQMLAFSFKFDYTYDTSGFFADANRKAVLEAAAASITDRIGDSFSAINPSGGNTWSVNFTSPGGGNDVSVSNPTVAANQILVYVGARTLGGSTLGQGGPTGFGGSGSSAWLATLRNRGQVGVDFNPATDVAPKAGAVVFDNATNWYFGVDDSGQTSSQNDFYSVAAHELGHVLGIGTSDSWDNLTSSGSFTGAKSVAYYGHSVPISDDKGHLGQGVIDPGSGQEVDMDPAITVGTRKDFTTLDFDVLDDIGYDIVAGGGGGGGGGGGTVSISGTIYNDLDNDGVKDANESGIQGAQVYLDLDNDGVFDSTEPTAYTDAAGQYSFFDLSAGTYKVRQTKLPDYDFGHPSSGNASVTLASGASATADFADVKHVNTTIKGKVTGILFNDKSGDGKKQSNENVLVGWRVFIDADHDGVFDSSETSTTTDGNGFYSLSAPVGNARVAIVKDSGYRYSTPGVGYYDVVLDKTTAVSGQNFAVSTSTLISGVVYEDKDGDGVRDSGEKGLSAWAVYVDANGNGNGKFDKNEANAITDGNGNFAFKTLAAGTYTVRVVQQGKYRVTYPSTKLYTFTLTSGGSKTDLKFAETVA